MNGTRLQSAVLRIRRKQYGYTFEQLEHGQKNFMITTKHNQMQKKILKQSQEGKQYLI